MADEVKKIIADVDAGKGTQSVAALRKEISTLRDALLNLEKGTQDYDAAVKQIEKDQAKIASVMKVSSDNTTKQEKALQAVNAEYKNQRQELSALKKAMENLEPTSAAYEKAFNRAAEITHNLTAQQEMLKYSSPDLGDQISNLTQIGSNLASGFGAVNAMMVLVGGDTEDLQKVMVKLQATMALVQGAKGLDGLIKRSTGFINAVTKWITQNKALTATTNAQTAALGQEAVAAGTATIATETFTKALVATGIGAIVVALGYLIANLDKAADAFKWLREKLFGVNEEKAKMLSITDDLNEAYEKQNESLDFEVRMMEATGATTQEVIDKKLELVKAQKAETEAAIANVKARQAQLQADGFWGRLWHGNLGELKASKKALEGLETMLSDLDGTLKSLNEDRAIADARDAYNSANKGSGQLFKGKERDATIEAYKQEIKEGRKAMEKIAYDDLTDYEQWLNDYYYPKLDDILGAQMGIESLLADPKYDSKEPMFEKWRLEMELEDYTKYLDELEKLRDKTRQSFLDADREKNGETFISKIEDEITKIKDYTSKRENEIQIRYAFVEANGKRDNLSPQDEMEMENELLFERLTYLSTIISEYKKIAENENLTDEQRLEAKEKITQTLMDIEDTETEHQLRKLEIEKDIADEKLNIWMDYSNSMSSIFADVASVWQDAIKVELDAGKISEEEAERRFEASKSLQYAEVLINTISGAWQAFINCQKAYGEPTGSIVGALQAAAITTSGIAQGVKIANTKLGSYNSGSAGGGSELTAIARPVINENPYSYTRNLTTAQEEERLNNPLKVYVLESDIREAMNQVEVRTAEATF